MSDKSKMLADQAHARKVMAREQANKKPDIAVRCRSCKKSQREVPVMVEMGGFVFCSECITAAYGVVAGRKAGR